MDGWMGGWVDGCVGGWVGGWVDGWMGLWVGGWVHVIIGNYAFYHNHPFIIFIYDKLLELIVLDGWLFSEPKM